MLINKPVTQHGLHDLLPVALFHTKRIAKVSEKLAKDHKMMQLRLAKKRKAKAEAELELAQTQRLEQLKIDNPREWQAYQQKQHEANLRNQARAKYYY